MTRDELDAIRAKVKHYGFIGSGSAFALLDAFDAATRERKDVMRQAEYAERDVARLQGLVEKRDALREFFRRCWDAARAAHDLEGSEVQEWGEELGLLVKVERKEPCGESCYCAEYYGTDEWPVECYWPFDSDEARAWLTRAQDTLNRKDVSDVAPTG